ncbi:MAG: SdiA-regulated domain-containing protein [Spirochaetales bacterium]|nr:SdiA-regulated domain-containing protein [Spirochaetales bacterium]
MKKIVSLLLFLILFNTGFSQEAFFYNIDQPDKEIVLPDILKEASGLTDIDSSHVALVQDEIGSIFIYNFQKESIIAEHKFAKKGDFEGLTFTGHSMYILRSDGWLFEWVDFSINTNSGKKNNYKLQLLTSDNEGLGYDSKNNRLLIAAKNKPSEKENKLYRYIYEFDLITKKLNNTPVYALDINKLENFAQNNNIKLNGRTKKGKLIKFNFLPASIAVHPKTEDIYIISAANYLITVVNPKGDVIHMEPLNKELFPQAEGITFLKNGTMIIANEAAGKKPTLLFFTMR